MATNTAFICVFGATFHCSHDQPSPMLFCPSVFLTIQLCTSYGSTYFLRILSMYLLIGDFCTVFDAGQRPLNTPIIVYPSLIVFLKAVNVIYEDSTASFYFFRKENLRMSSIFVDSTRVISSTENVKSDGNIFSTAYYSRRIYDPSQFL